jgi:hypothetical protein
VYVIILCCVCVFVYGDENILAVCKYVMLCTVCVWGRGKTQVT